MKIKLIASVLVICVSASLAKAEVPSNTIGGTLLGGVAGAIIGNNSGSRNAEKGALIGAAAGLIVGATMDSRRQERTVVYSQPAPVYTTVYQSTPAPVYVTQYPAPAPQVVYVQSAPAPVQYVYTQPAPVVIYRSAPVYYGQRHNYSHWDNRGYRPNGNYRR